MGHEFSRAPRHSLIRRASLRWDNGSIEVRLRNISTGGALLECIRGLPPGTAIALDLHGCGELVAEVRWSESGRMGIRFAQQFDLGRLSNAKKVGPQSSMLRPDYLSGAGTPAASSWTAPKRRLGIGDL
jgi:hypothetical protein